MTQQGHILIADDEATFLEATAELLRREGYQCDTVTSGAAALERVSRTQYDLLISDLEMPGNGDLALVREIAERVGGLPVIIITGFPSTRSAIASIDLPVAAYLVKPVDFGELLIRAERAISRYRSYRSVRGAEEQLEAWREELSRPRGDDSEQASASSVDAFLALTLRNVMGSLTDLEQLRRALAEQPVGPHACQILNCPRGLELRDAVRRTVAVLEETKGAFKSKVLADLRRELEAVLQRH